ncbi:MAG: energy transducer TonB [Alphaproteobacteria bacterium]
MNPRLIIALPVAAAVVAALFWAMSEFVPVERPQAVYTMQVAPGMVKIYRCPHSCDHPAPVRPRYPQRPGSGPQPPPPPVLSPEPVNPNRRPMERFPDPGSADDLDEDPCAGSPIIRTPPIFPKEARHGDYAVVKFTITEEGTTADVRIIELSNPKIREDVLRIVRRWRVRDECGRGILDTGDPGPHRVRIEFKFEEGSGERR